MKKLMFLSLGLLVSSSLVEAQSNLPSCNSNSDCPKGFICTGGSCWGGAPVPVIPLDPTQPTAQQIACNNKPDGTACSYFYTLPAPAIGTIAMRGYCFGGFCGQVVNARPLGDECYQSSECQSGCCSNEAGPVRMNAPKSGICVNQVACDAL